MGKPVTESNLSLHLPAQKSRLSQSSQAMYGHAPPTLVPDRAQNVTICMLRGVRALRLSATWKVLPRRHCRSPKEIDTARRRAAVIVIVLKVWHEENMVEVAEIIRYGGTLEGELGGW
jgi:hypothetical protein